MKPSELAILRKKCKQLSNELAPKIGEAVDRVNERYAAAGVTLNSNATVDSGVDRAFLKRIANLEHLKDPHQPTSSTGT